MAKTIFRETAEMLLGYYDERLDESTIVALTAILQRETQFSVVNRVHCMIWEEKTLPDLLDTEMFTLVLRAQGTPSEEDE